MPCLLKKEIPQRSRFAYSSDWFRHPKRLQKKAEEYAYTLSGIVHGKFVDVSEYFLIGDKRAVLVSAPDIATEFRSLAKQWKRETGFRSSLSEKFTHPAYQRIMAMGKSALPFILRDLQHNSGHWFYALRFIAGKDIAAKTNNPSDARDAWLEWGYKNGHV
jgi:hypothetical protein